MKRTGLLFLAALSLLVSGCQKHDLVSHSLCDSGSYNDSLAKELQGVWREVDGEKEATDVVFHRASFAELVLANPRSYSGKLTGENLANSRKMGVFRPCQILTEDVLELQITKEDGPTKYGYYKVETKTNGNLSLNEYIFTKEDLDSLGYEYELEESKYSTAKITLWNENLSKQEVMQAMSLKDKATILQKVR